MFFSSPSLHRPNAHAPMPGLRSSGRLDTALAALPAPWKVLRNRRTSALDGPPWVKYLIFHPEKGIALLDLLPAKPEAAIAPLDEFLAQTGFAAFSHGDPPIVALALTERDIPNAADALAEAFAAAPRCGITNMNWVDAIADLLMSTEGLLLAPLEPAAARRSEGWRASARPERAEAAATSTPPAPPPSVQPERNPHQATAPDRPSASKPPQPEKPEAEQKASIKVPAETDPKRPEKASASAPPRSGSVPHRGSASITLAQEPKPQQPDRTSAESPQPAKPEPKDEVKIGAAAEAASRRSEETPAKEQPSQLPESEDEGQAWVRLSGETEAIWRTGRPQGLRRRSWRERPYALSALAASLLAAAAITVLYSHAPSVTSKKASPQQIRDLAAAASNISPPEENVLSAVPPLANRAPPTAATKAMPETAPHATAGTSPPQPMIQIPGKVALQTPPLPAPALQGPRAPHRHRAKETHAKQPVNRQSEGEDTPTFHLPEAPASEQTVVIDGVPYVKGREPHALGTVTQPPTPVESELGFAPAPTTGETGNN